MGMRHRWRRGADGGDGVRREPVGEGVSAFPFSRASNEPRDREAGQGEGAGPPVGVVKSTGGGMGVRGFTMGGADGSI